MCAGAYLFGSAVRYNIAAIERDAASRSGLERRLEDLASWSQAFAYIISVAYYLNLFGAFGVSLTPLNDHFHAKALTGAVLLLVPVVGWTCGFAALEQMEQISVGIKLAIIAGLLVGLGIFFARQAGTGDLMLNPADRTGWPAMTLAFGLIVTVQGGEASLYSRYLGADYDAETRIRSMRFAQLLSAAIYMIYIGLLANVFKAGQLEPDETAIIGMMEVVAPILPVLLVSATEALTWTVNIFEIISYVSRAFAFHYALQAVTAGVAAWRAPSQKGRALAFAALAVQGPLITVIGAPVE